jgi:hypothetical protein
MQHQALAVVQTWITCNLTQHSSSLIETETSFLNIRVQWYRNAPLFQANARPKERLCDVSSCDLWYYSRSVFNYNLTAQSKKSSCRLWSAMVKVLTIGPKVRGRGDGMFKVMKIHSTPYFGGKIKQSAPCCKILRHVKELYDYKREISWKKSIISLAQILLICY